jgi:hypothetical protein
MYAFTIALYNGGIKTVDLYLDLMAQPPWDTDYTLNGESQAHVPLKGPVMALSSSHDVLRLMLGSPALAASHQSRVPGEAPLGVAARCRGHTGAVCARLPPGRGPAGRAPCARRLPLPGRCLGTGLERTLAGHSPTHPPTPPTPQASPTTSCTTPTPWTTSWTAHSRRARWASGSSTSACGVASPSAGTRETRPRA